MTATITTFLVERSLPRPRIHAHRTCEWIATPVTEEPLGPDLVDPIFCKCLVAPDAVEEEQVTSWPLVTMKGRPHIYPHDELNGQLWITHSSGKRLAGSFAPLGFKVQVNDTVDLPDPDVAMVVAAPGVIVGMVFRMPAFGPVPKSYWPLPFTSTVWPFVDTSHVTADCIPATLAEAVQVMRGGYAQREGYVALPLDAAAAELSGFLSVIALLELANPFIGNIAHRVGITGPLLSLAEKREGILAIAQQVRVTVPPGLPML